MIDEKKLINYINAEINPYGKPFNGTAYEFGLKLIDYIEGMEKQPQVGGVGKNFETILLFAVRYAIGRRTYIPSRAIDYITPLLPYLSEDVLKLIANEITGRYTYEGALGGEKIDKPYWIEFLRKIRLEIGGRNEL